MLCEWITGSGHKRHHSWVFAKNVLYLGFLADGVFNGLKRRLGLRKQWGCKQKQICTVQRKDERDSCRCQVSLQSECWIWVFSVSLAVNVTPVWLPAVRYLLCLLYCCMDQCPDSINSCICLVHFSLYYTAKTLRTCCLNDVCTYQTAAFSSLHRICKDEKMKLDSYDQWKIDSLPSLRKWWTYIFADE